MDSSSENPVLNAYNSWASTKPYVTRSFCIYMVISFFIFAFFPSLGSALNCNLRYAVYSFEIYRVATAGLIVQGIMAPIMGVLMFGHMGARLEATKGSAAMLALLGIMDVMGNSLFLLISFGRTVFGDSGAQFATSGGIMNILFAMMAIEAMQQPDSPRRFMFLPFEMKAKYTPLAMFGLMTLFAGFMMDQAVFLALGYAYGDNRLSKLDPSPSLLQSWEHGGWLTSLTHRVGYIGANNTAQDGVYSAVPLMDTHSRPAAAGASGRGAFHTLNEPAPAAPSKPGKPAFVGSGQTLGSSMTSHNPTDPAAARAARLAALGGQSA